MAVRWSIQGGPLNPARARGLVLINVIGFCKL